MVQSVGDPYTVFLDPKQNSDFELSLSGTYEGIGIEIDIRDNQLVVVAPIDGTPAQKAAPRRHQVRLPHRRSSVKAQGQDSGKVVL